MEQALNTDYTVSGGPDTLPSLPLADGTLSGPLLLQVEEMVNVQEQRKRQLAEQPAGRRTLKLLLSDGRQRVRAVELEPLERLEMPMLGCKLLLRDVPVAAGVLLLTPGNTRVMGGGVLALQAKLQAVKRQLQEDEANLSTGKRQRTGAAGAGASAGGGGGGSGSGRALAPLPASGGGGGGGAPVAPPRAAAPRAAAPAPRAASPVPEPAAPEPVPEPAAPERGDSTEEDDSVSSRQSAAPEPAPEPEPVPEVEVEAAPAARWQRRQMAASTASPAGQDNNEPAAAPASAARSFGYPRPSQSSESSAASKSSSSKSSQVRYSGASSSASSVAVAPPPVASSGSQLSLTQLLAQMRSAESVTGHFRCRVSEASKPKGQKLEYDSGSFELELILKDVAAQQQLQVQLADALIQESVQMSARELGQLVDSDDASDKARCKGVGKAMKQMIKSIHGVVTLDVRSGCVPMLIKFD